MPSVLQIIILNIALKWKLYNFPNPEITTAYRYHANNCYKFIIDLATNGVVITDAIKYVQSQMEHLNKTEKTLLQDIQQKEDIEEQKTHNGVF